MKKIIFIIESYSGGGGAENLLTNIVNHLNPDKYEISIIEILHYDVKIEPANKNINILPYMMRADDPLRKQKMYSFYHEWDKVIEKYIPQDYDLYVSFNYQRPSFLLPKGKRNIAWVHSDVYNLATEKMAEERELQKKAFENVSKIVSISDITTQSLMDLFPESKEKVVEIYCGLDIEKVHKMSCEETEIKLQHPALIVGGRFVERKRPVKAVEVLQKIHEKQPGVHLYYMGYGELERDTRQKAEELGLSEYVHFLGFVPNQYPILRQADVCVQFSVREGFPAIFMEAVALNVPFVSSLVGGVRILANNETCGKVVDTNEEAAEAVLNFLHKDKKEIVAACEKSIKRFEFAPYIKRLEEFFDDVMTEE